MENKEYENFKFRLGIRLQTYRRKHGISQSQFAKKLGCSDTYISNIETGKQKCPAVIVYEYARSFSVSANELLGLDLVDLDKTPKNASDNIEKINSLLPLLDNAHQELILMLVQTLYKDTKED